MQLHHQTQEDEQRTAASTTPVAHSALQVQHTTEGENEVLVSQPVLALLATAEKQKAQRKWLAFIGLWVATQVALVTAYPHSPISVFSYACTGFLIPFICGMFVLRYRATTQALAQVDDVRMVGPLLDRLHVGRKGIRTRRLIRQALMRLLPRLQASDASLLTPGQKGALVRRLAHLALFQRDKEFQVIILRALEQVGDEQAIPVVENIVRRQPHWAAQEQVHAAAEECLPFLLQRAEEASSRQTLLRAASQEVEGSSALLLRPAQGAEVVLPHELLRADLSCSPTPQPPDERA